MSLARMLIAELREECATCEGMGTALDLTSKKTPLPRWRCIACGGRGWRLSALGRELADTLRPALAEYFADKDHTHDRNYQ